MALWEKEPTAEGREEEGARVGSSPGLAVTLAAQALRRAAGAWGAAGLLLVTGTQLQDFPPVFWNDLRLCDLVWVTGSHPVGRGALSGKGLEWSSIACS